MDMTTYTSSPTDVKIKHEGVLKRALVGMLDGAFRFVYTPCDKFAIGIPDVLLIDNNTTVAIELKLKNDIWRIPGSQEFCLSRIASAGGFSVIAGCSKLRTANSQAAAILATVSTLLFKAPLIKRVVAEPERYLAILRKGEALSAKSERHILILNRDLTCSVGMFGNSERPMWMTVR